MKVIGLLSDIGAGKTVAGRYISEKYKFHRYTISSYIRAKAREQKKKPTRGNLFKIARNLENEHGKDYFIKKIAEDAKEDKAEKIVIDGLRAPYQIKACRQVFKGIKFVLIKAKPEIRFKRIKERGRTGAPKTFKEFKEMERNEWKEFNFKKVFKMADYVLHNNGTIEEFYKKIDSVLRKII